MTHTERTTLGGELVEQALLPGVEPVSETAQRIAAELTRRNARRGHAGAAGPLFDTAHHAGDLFAQHEADKAEAERTQRRTARQALNLAAARKYGALYGDGEHHLAGELLVWRGVVIVCHYEADSAVTLAHVAMHQLHPPRVVVSTQTIKRDGRELVIEQLGTDAQPLTSTGYRSHFVAAATVDALGGPAAFIRRELDAAAAANKAWAKRHP